jgi:hypothetical protein
VIWGVGVLAAVTWFTNTEMESHTKISLYETAPVTPSPGGCGSLHMHQHKDDVGHYHLWVVELIVCCSVGSGGSHTNTRPTIDHGLHVPGLVLWLVQLRRGNYGVPSHADGTTHRDEVNL